jgi:5-formyltetrahydrofolate cyclo-ligase
LFDTIEIIKVTKAGTKKVLRKRMLSEREAMNADAKKMYDQWICESLVRMVEELNYKAVHCYLPMGAEIDLIPFIEVLLKKGITVVTPKTLPNRKLENLVLTSLLDVEQGVFGTTHPSGGNKFTGHFDLIIVPGLAYDASNHRLGYGGGYYDNFLVNHKSKKVGVFYPFQEVSQVPIEAHDIKLDAVLVNLTL